MEAIETDDTDFGSEKDNHNVKDAKAHESVDIDIEFKNDGM